MDIAKLVVSVDQMTPMMTAGEVALALGVTYQTVMRWAREGRLHSVRLMGRTRRFHPAYIEQVINHGVDGANARWQRSDDRKDAIDSQGGE